MISEQNPRGTGAGVGKIDVGIGVIDRQPINLPEHPIRQNAVQVERDNDGHRRPRHLANALEKKPLRVELPIRTHGTVQ